MASPLESTFCCTIRAKRRRRKISAWIRNTKNNLKYLLRTPHDKFSVWIVHSHCIARKITKMIIRIYLLQSNASWIIPDLNKTRKTILNNNGSEKFSDALHEAPSNSLQICSIDCEKRQPFWKLILFTFAKSGTIVQSYKLQNSSFLKDYFVMHFAKWHVF